MSWRPLFVDFRRRLLVFARMLTSHGCGLLLFFFYYYFVWFYFHLFSFQHFFFFFIVRIYVLCALVSCREIFHVFGVATIHIYIFFHICFCFRAKKEVRSLAEVNTLVAIVAAFFLLFFFLLYLGGP